MSGQELDCPALTSKQLSALWLLLTQDKTQPIKMTITVSKMFQFKCSLDAYEPQPILKNLPESPFLALTEALRGEGGIAIPLCAGGN